MSDPHASRETKMLFQNLASLSEKQILFGHQHATEYGHGWSGDENRSDVNSVVGSHPAVIGVDFSGFTGRSEKAILRYKSLLKKNVTDTYRRGGISTVSWHYGNPVTGGSFQWTASDSIRIVEKLLPGGSHHDVYKKTLRDIADWTLDLKDDAGKPIPLIFRPYHEFDGDWFWWGKAHTTQTEFIDLWRFTVSYLRDTLGVHQFIYGFSPDNRFHNEEEFLERYPGDEWVDLVGMDNYGDLGRDRTSIDTAAMKLKIVSDFAIKHRKLAAFTETGFESIPLSTWWTETLLKILKSQDLRLCYVLVWRNDTHNPIHYYAPFPGQTSSENFIKFYADPFTIFEKDLNHIYSKKIR